MSPTHYSDTVHENFQLILILFFRRYPKPPATAQKPSIAFIYRDGLDPWAYDLLLAINEVDSDFEMQLVYPSTFMSQENVKRLARKFEVVMNVIIDEITRRQRIKNNGRCH